VKINELNEMKIEVSEIGPTFLSKFRYSFLRFRGRRGDCSVALDNTTTLHTFSHSLRVG